MKCKLMDIIGGNKKFFILAICLMGLMFSSCRFLTRLYLESGGIHKTTLPLSSDIKMRARKRLQEDDLFIGYTHSFYQFGMIVIFSYNEKEMHIV
ncbi:MAG: hypothetical protein II521_10660, partial [Prevotella sp.]|nr:hypothetical protein [Prevotella sp.]